MRWLAVVGLLLSLLPTFASAQVGCSFQNGFASVANALLGAVGTCTGPEQAEAQYPGWVVQHTTTGMMIWRAQDGFLGFTNGPWIWRLTADGVQRSAAPQVQKPAQTAQRSLPPCWLVAQTWVPQSQIDSINNLLRQMGGAPIQATAGPMPACDPYAPPPQQQTPSGVVCFTFVPTMTLCEPT